MPSYTVTVTDAQDLALNTQMVGVGTYINKVIESQAVFATQRIQDDLLKYCNTNNVAKIKTGSTDARLDIVANRATKSNQAIRFAVDSDEKPILSITTHGLVIARSEGGANQNVELIQGSAKVWSHTNYSDNSLRDAYNVSSLTDQGTGRYDHNFTNNMNNANYSGHMSLRNNINQWWVGSYATSSCRTNSYTGSAYSDQHHKLAVFGDMA